MKESPLQQAPSSSPSSRVLRTFSPPFVSSSLPSSSASASSSEFIFPQWAPVYDVRILFRFLTTLPLYIHPLVKSISCTYPVGIFAQPPRTDIPYVSPHSAIAPRATMNQFPADAGFVEPSHSPHVPSLPHSHQGFPSVSLSRSSSPSLSMLDR